MKVLFFDCHNPYIIVRFKNADYKYEGFEYGEFNILKKRYYKKPGELLQYLKNKKFFYRKVELNI